MKKLILLICLTSLFLTAQETIKVPSGKSITITINNNNNDGVTPIQSITPIQSTTLIQSTAPIIESQKKSGWGETTNNTNNRFFKHNSSIFSGRANNRDCFYLNLGFGVFNDNDVDNDVDDNTGSINHFSVGYSWVITSNFNVGLEFGSYTGEYDDLPFPGGGDVTFDFSYLALKGAFFLTPSFSIYAKLVSPGDMTITVSDSFFSKEIEIALKREIDNFIAIGANFWFSKTFGISAEMFDFKVDKNNTTSIATIQLNFKF